MRGERTQAPHGMGAYSAFHSVWGDTQQYNGLRPQIEVQDERKYDIDWGKD